MNKAKRVLDHMPAEDASVICAEIGVIDEKATPLKQARYRRKAKNYKARIDKATEYTKRFTNGKTSRIDTFENVELVLETILQILKGE